ncbi:MltF family protein [Mesohalobacter halotolerans]|uniref:Transporter substrate-binding domain-containing protein n=1 Tax=Mesohalobacter halotolerans TaxID=1883405 RepID=A0A4U5TNM2_9FLAO|nr:transporter substrate-binding domain-containing protein [Mesohalobacter halotolerans]TKS55476.1 transporter substrate-binding domain-containing protein [Mesohalobacter halotolerans]
MRLKIFFSLILLILLSCNDDNTFNGTELSKNRKFKDIVESGRIRAITTYSGTTYFLYRGRPMGFEYEILKKFAEDLNLELEIVIAKDENDLIKMLNKNEGDIIAYGYTITEERQKKIDFSIPLYLSHQVLIQKKPENWRRMKLHNIKEQLITNPVELIGDTVSVKRNSSYAQRLLNLSEEIGGKIYIDTIPGQMTTDEIFKNVAEGKIKYSIVDQNVASIYASDYPILDISTKMSFSQRIAWGLRKNSEQLKDTLNHWLKRAKKTVDYHVIYNKYFKNRRSFRKRVKSEFYSLNEQKISPYDDLIQKYATEIGWDWRLIASIVYQESQFRPSNKSWAGASGLMQIMPKTAEELKITNPTDPEQSLRGGTRYLSQMWQAHETIPDSIQRIKFTLASYNAGLYHIKDAQRLAAHLDLDPLKWDKNAEDALLKLNKPEYYKKDFIKYGYVRAKEPYKYVKEIFKRYEQYKTFIDKTPPGK